MCNPSIEAQFEGYDLQSYSPQTNMSYQGAEYPHSFLSINQLTSVWKGKPRICVPTWNPSGGFYLICRSHWPSCGELAIEQAEINIQRERKSSSPNLILSQESCNRISSVLPSVSFTFHEPELLLTHRLKLGFVHPPRLPGDVNRFFRCRTGRHRCSPDRFLDHFYAFRHRLHRADTNSTATNVTTQTDLSHRDPP
jgi:hypothetical protein